MARPRVVWEAKRLILSGTALTRYFGESNMASSHAFSAEYRGHRYMVLKRFDRLAVFPCFLPAVLERPGAQPVVPLS